MTAVVTGYGVVTPLGADAASTWEAVLAGRSGARRLTDDWAEALPVQVAAPAAPGWSDRLDPAKTRTLDRGQQLALAAADEAWRHAGQPDVDPERLAVVVGTGIGGLLTILEQDAVMRDRGPRRVSPWTVPAIMPNGPAAAVGLAHRARAGVHSPVSACASGAEAIAWALDLLRAGRADVVIAGGAEATIAPLPLAAFAAMRALSSRDGDPAAASRPFDKGRDGFVLGEGAGMVVLESEAHASARQAKTCGRLLGAGWSNDSHHVAAPDPVGAGAARAMRLALTDAEISPGELDHVNAHATSTPAGDVAEASAIRHALGEAATSVPVTATKSCTGHLLGAAGAVEAVLTLQALEARSVPAVRNLDDPDDEVQLDLIRFEPRPGRGDFALSNSFGFGGHNVSLVLGASR